MKSGDYTNYWEQAVVGEMAILQQLPRSHFLPERKIDCPLPTCHVVKVCSRYFWGKLTASNPLNLSRSEHNCSVSQKHLRHCDLSQKSSCPPVLIGGSPTLLEQHRCKVYVPPSYRGPTCRRLSHHHRCTRDDSEARHSRNTARRIQFSNK